MHVWRGTSSRLVIAACANLPGAAWAHAIGERYDLPAPLAYFVAGAALTVALSFVVSAMIARGAAQVHASGGCAVSLGPLLPLLRHALRPVAIALLLLVVIAGLYGDPHPAKNVAPTLIWIVWWVGMSLTVACVGNVWPALDPWRALFEAADALARRAGMSGVAIGWTYPQALGSWPAVILLLFFGWLEVIYPLASVPAQIAWLVLAWTALTLAGMTLFGRAVWQQHADVFALYFATLGRFAPLGGGPDERRVLLRLPGSGLLGGDATSAAIVAFVMAMLATVLFDGLLGTQAWRLLDRTVGGWFPQLLDRDGYILGTAGLLGVWLMFLGAYWMTCLITARLVRGHPADAIAGLFVLSLVPIAVAYNFAHNFSYLLVQGQGLIPLMSDPLGRGWNLFGTVLYKPDIGIVDARFTWYVAIGAIVVGHVIAVWLAHRAALQAFAELRVAVIATIPLTVLMVIYTAISLSIIAEPLVRFRTPDPSYSLNSILRHGDPQPPPPAVSITTRSPLFSTQ